MSDGTAKNQLKFVQHRLPAPKPLTGTKWKLTTIESSEGKFNASIKLQVDAGKIYYVEHSVSGIRGSAMDVWLQKIDDKAGRQLVKSNRML